MIQVCVAQQDCGGTVGACGIVAPERGQRAEAKSCTAARLAWFWRPAVPWLGVVGAVLAIRGGINVAYAESVRGFAMSDRRVAVALDRICTPLVVKAAVAQGAVSCAALAPADLPGLALAGAAARARYVASGSGAVLTVRDGDQVVVTWTAPHPVGQVVSVQQSEAGDRVVVWYRTRRMGREVTEVVVFDLRADQLTPAHATGVHQPGSPEARAAETAPPPLDESAGRPPAGPNAKAAALAVQARRARGKAAVAAWHRVVKADGAWVDGHYELAKACATQGQTSAAIAVLSGLRDSRDPRGAEWLVVARFDNAFAKLRAEPAFRALVGYERQAATGFERVMGQGGTWEQTGTGCDTPTVALTFTPARTFALEVVAKCDGQRITSRFRGSWRADSMSKVTLLVPPQAGATGGDPIACEFRSRGQEDGLQCEVDEDLGFFALPVRR